jgi:hypothetical protein
LEDLETNSEIRKEVEGIFTKKLKLKKKSRASHFELLRQHKMIANPALKDSFLSNSPCFFQKSFFFNVNPDKNSSSNSSSEEESNKPKLNPTIMKVPQRKSEMLLKRKTSFQMIMNHLTTGFSSFYETPSIGRGDSLSKKTKTKEPE